MEEGGRGGVEEGGGAGGIVRTYPVRVLAGPPVAARRRCAPPSLCCKQDLATPPVGRFCSLLADGGPWRGGSQAHSITGALGGHLRKPRLHTRERGSERGKEEGIKGRREQRREEGGGSMKERQGGIRVKPADEDAEIKKMVVVTKGGDRGRR